MKAIRGTHYPVPAVLVGICAALCFQATVALAAPVEINVATAYADDNFQTQNLQKFADELSSDTGGQVNFKIHSGGKLLKTPMDILSGVRAGKAQAGEAIMSGLSKEDVMFGIDSLPFIVSGYDDARRLWETSRPAIEKALTARGLQLLYVVPWPTQNLYSNREINNIKDFKGLTMRTYSPSTVRIAELVGATPVTIQVVDLAKMIADEKLDLMLTSSWTGVDTKAWTKMKYYYKVNAWYPKNMVFMDKKIFDSFDSATRVKILAAASVAEKRGWQLSQATDEGYEKQLVANKIKVSTMDFFIRTYLDRIGETVAREWLKKATGEELKVLLKYTTERSLNSGATAASSK